MRALAIIVLTLTPMVSISCSRKSRCTWVNGHSEPASMTPSTWSSNTIGTIITLTGRASPIAEEIRT